MKFKKLAAKAAAIICTIALILPVAVTKAEAAEAKTLAEHAIGTVFKLSEDGTLYDWILISHNYEGTGNQLLMRKDCIYYATGIVYGIYYYDGEATTYGQCLPRFYSSPLKTYLNEQYITKFTEIIQDRLKEVTIETYEKDSSKLVNDTLKIFILSENEMFGTVYPYTSYLNYCTNTATGQYINYFSSNEKRAADQAYMVRDGDCSGTYTHSSHPQYGGTVVSASGVKSAGYNNYAVECARRSGWYAPSSYYRPCLVLPADTPAVANEEIKGEIIPTIDSVDVTDTWAKSNTVTINATDAEAYALTSSDAEPTSGWQQSSSFEVNANGTYYAWVKSVTDNTAYTPVTVSYVDDIAPTISAVDVPDAWATAKTIRVTAADSQSGIFGYAITTEDITPSAGAGLQASPQFTFISNGSYYVWAKDNAGNVSAGYGFEISKIDTDKPVISEVTYPSDWVSAVDVTITAEDATSQLVYAVSSSSTAPLSGWQASPQFVLTSGGSFYAWAKDEAGNTAYKYFYFNKFDNTPPEISNIYFNTNNTVMTVSATDMGSGVKSIIIDGTAYSGGYTQYQLPAGTKYVTLQAEDKAGNRSPERRERVPGWYDTLGTLAITSVDFDADITTATITAETTATAIKGTYVNDKLYAANPVIYALGNSTKYLLMQVEDVNGDRSALYKVRVPGWNEQTATLEITGCVFSEDNTSAVITATETVENEADRRGITGIKINGEFFEGNPVAYPIPEGTRHLEMVAYNTDGDYSPTLIRRVPGWSEVVSTLAITNCQFSDYNKRATITALATGGDSVAGIFVNGEFFEGNPVIYSIDKKTDVLHMQAANYNGDLSAMVNKDVPQDTSKSTLKLTITAPGWTSASRAKVKITATDKSAIREVLAKTGEDDDWVDVTDSHYIYITEDTTVWASAENDEGTVKEAYLDITCFDRKAPTVTAAQQDKVVNIRAEDDKSGVKAIYVNNVEYSGSKIYGGNLRYTIPDGTTTVTVKAVDEAGNESETVELAVKATVTAIPMVISPSSSTPP